MGEAHVTYKLMVDMDCVSESLLKSDLVSAMNGVDAHIFEKMDVDGSGSVSQEEYNQWIEHEVREKEAHRTGAGLHW